MSQIEQLLLLLKRSQDPNADPYKNSNSIAKPAEEKEDVDIFKDDFCSHQRSTLEKGTETCLDCGLEMNFDFSTEAEWRYFGSDSQGKSDPSRCTYRKVEDKSIYKDLKNMNIERSVMEEANRLFAVVTVGKIRRNNSRRAVICAAVFTAFKYQMNPVCPDELRAKFDLTKKEMSKGLNFVNLNLGSHRQAIYITPETLMPRFLKLFTSSEEHLANTIRLYQIVQSKSNDLKVTHPKSACCGLIFFYCRLIKKPIAVDTFAKIIGLSAVTVMRVAKSISEILKTEHVVKLS